MSLRPAQTCLGRRLRPAVLTLAVLMLAEPLTAVAAPKTAASKTGPRKSSAKNGPAAASAVPAPPATPASPAIATPSASAGAAAIQASKIEPRRLDTEDSWPIAVTYYYGSAQTEALAKETPVVVLLHGSNQNRLIWQAKEGLASRLQREGYAVITVDLRKHGQSVDHNRARGEGSGVDGANLQPADLTNIVAYDMDAVKDFIFAEHQAKRLNMNKMGIVASEWSGIVALQFAADDWNREPFEDGATPETCTPRGQDVRALVLLSPPQRFKSLSVTEALNELREPSWGVSLLMLYGKLNKTDAKDAETIQRRLTRGVKKDEDRFEIVPYNYNLRGTSLLGKKEIDAESEIVAFLKSHLKAVKSDWRDRRNRLTTR